MATSKPISSISYNSEEFLRVKLESWLKAHIIQTYMYIKHVGEDGDKNHIHFRIEPNKKLDPMDLQEDLKEYTKDNKKPLGCRPFRPSKEEDWFLYAVHDKEYLRIKYGGGEKGEKLPYKWQDIVTPDNYDLEVAFIRARSKLEHTSSNLMIRLKDGAKPLDLIIEGENAYTVNALSNALRGNDYIRIVAEYNKLKEEYANIKLAITNSDLVLFDEGGIYLLIPKKEFFEEISY